MQYIDLTQTFNSDMPVYPGDSKPELISMDTDGIMDHKLSTGMHVGTHMDGPLHMVPGGKRLSEIDVKNFFGRGKLIDARGRLEVDADFLQGVEAGDMVFVLTGHASKFRDPDYYETYPKLTEALAERLVALKVKLVGMDTPSPDYAPYNVHKILLSHEILIIENLTNLEKLLNKDFEVVALPAKLDTDAAPVRVIAKINN